MSRAAAAALAALLAACAPERQEAGPRAAPPYVAGGAVVMGDGARLPLRAWVPESPPRAAILGVHGLNDYGAAFAIPAASWTAAGVAVYAFDQRGFGAAPRPGIWPGLRTLVDDLDEAAAAVQALRPGLPLYVVGVSMGGAATLAALGEGKLAGIAGAVLVAPAVWAREAMPAPQRALLWLAARVAPGLELSGRGIGIEPSDNLDMLRALARDPLVRKKTRVDALEGLVDLMDRAFDSTPRTAAPLLVLYGGNDQLVPAAPTKEAVRRLGAAARIGVYPEGYHMLLRGLRAGKVHADVLAWIADPAAALPSGAEDAARRFFSWAAAPPGARVSGGRRRPAGCRRAAPAAPPPPSGGPRRSSSRRGRTARPGRRLRREICSRSGRSPECRAPRPWRAAARTCLPARPSPARPPE